MNSEGLRKLVDMRTIKKETTASENAVTRRSFLAGSAGVAALAAGSGFLSFNAWKQAGAEESSGSIEGTVHTLCNACSNKCGFTAYVRGGRLIKMIGDANHPHAQGKLCARGYGYSQIAYSKDRLTDPLKKMDTGSFEAISWDQAYQEIAEKVAAIIDVDGPRALALVHNPRPSGSFYAPRFMHALGSPNVYTHEAACNLSQASGFAQVIGESFISDVENSRMTMFIGRSYADAIRPDRVAALQKAHDRGSHIVLVDPRLSNSSVFADEWVPINPGTDLALILAMSNVLVSQGLFDKAYVDANSVGFDDWAAQLRTYTPEWAETLTGIPSATIRRIAAEFADAAPAASIEPSWRGAFGCSYQNSGETARAVCAFNTLLGCWNQEGGALIVPDVMPGALDEEAFAPVPVPTGTTLGAEEYPLASPEMGTNLYALRMAKDNMLKGMFFYNSNMAAGYSNPTYIAEALSKLALCVVIDVQMSETAQLADYVLPDTSYLERRELPEYISGKVPCVALRDQVLRVIHPNTKPVDVIFSELAEACGVGQYFQFTLDELADAQLRTLGLSLNGLRNTGVSYVQNQAFSYGQTPEWKTPTGKIQFSSEAVAAAGYSPVPVWVKPKEMPLGNELRVIGGKQSMHSNTQTANIESLMAITQDYDLARVWLNAAVAADLGIEDGDEVEVSNTNHTGTVRAKVTERINPTALFMPSAYGCTSEQLTTAHGVGLRQMDYVPFDMEPGYGAAMTQEACVFVKKAGA